MKSKGWRICYKANFKKVEKSSFLFFNTTNVVNCSESYECTEWFREPVEMYLELALDICQQHFVKVGDIKDIIPGSTTLNPYSWNPIG